MIKLCDYYDRGMCLSRGKNGKGSYDGCHLKDLPEEILKIYIPICPKNIEGKLE